MTISNFVLATLLVLFTSKALADSHSGKVILRIGTGGTAGTYFPIGSVIANTINTIDSTKDKQEIEGPKLVALAQRSLGSVSNVTDLSNGLLDAALAQANVIHYAFYGTGPFENQEPNKNLKGIAALYIESLHLVVRHDAPIKTVNDLAGKRVSLDEIGSGTQLDMQTILNAYQIDLNSFNAVYLKTSDAIDRIRSNELDALFLLAGYPINAVSKLIDDGIARIVPISGTPVDSILEAIPYFTANEIPKNTYGNAEAIKTLGVPAQMVIDSRIPDDTAYKITKALWSARNLTALSNGHPKGCEIRTQSALMEMYIPLHDGARRYYEEAGLLGNK